MRRPLRAVVVALALAAAPPATASAGWMNASGFAIAAATAGDVAAAPDGSATAAWSTPGGLSLQHAVPSGTFASPVTVAGEASPPAVAVAPSGASAVAWIGRRAQDDRYVTRVAFLDAAGALVRLVDAATLPEDASSATAQSVDVALDAAGVATVAWTDGDEALAAHARPDGGHSAPVSLGPGTLVQAAAAPDGPAWVAWARDDPAHAAVARLTAAGAIDAGPAVVSSAVVTGPPRLVAAASGAAVVWPTDDPDNDLDDPEADNRFWVQGVRLPRAGALTAESFATPSVPNALTGNGVSAFDGYDAAILPGGTVAVAWHEVDSLSGFAKVSYSRFAPGQTTAGRQPLVGTDVTPASLAPRLSAAPDGALLATWLQTPNLLTFNFDVGARRVAPDGTLGAADRLGFSAGGLAGALPVVAPFAGAATGAGVVGVATGGPVLGGQWDLRLYRYDALGPTLAVDVPASATVLTAVRFSATVADPADAPIAWDFGDGGTGQGPVVTHAYAGTGTFLVTARADDGHGNTTMVKRELAVVAPPTQQPGPPPPTVAAEPVAAALKVTKATRKGARVTVVGTISKKASGKVSVAYAQKVGRRTTTVRRSARIAKGRWSVTLTLPRKLTRGRAATGKGTVTATFAGTAAVKKATARRGVTVARTAPKAKGPKR
jgi:hypothetical protein